MRPGVLTLIITVVACKPADQVPLPSGKESVTVALASPIGYVKASDRLIIWHRSPSISRYEVVVSDSVETPIFSAVTADTQVVLPEAFHYSLSQNYRWYVIAYRDRDSTAWRSPIAVYRLEGEGRRMPPLPAP